MGSSGKGWLDLTTNNDHTTTVKWTYNNNFENRHGAIPYGKNSLIVLLGHVIYFLLTHLVVDHEQFNLLSENVQKDGNI